MSPNSRPALSGSHFLLMRPKYVTPAIVIARTPLGEASALVTLLTADFGLIRVRAQGVRKSGAKLSSALRTLSEVDTHILYGKEGWRLSGATQTVDHCTGLSSAARGRAGRISLLVLRLVHGETKELELFNAFRELLLALTKGSEEEQDAAECRAALRILSALGLAAGDIPDTTGVLANRKTIVARINKGIAASGL